MDRGAWWATAHGVPKSQTHLGTTTAKHLKKKKSWSIQSDNSRMERRKRKRQEIK